MTTTTRHGAVRHNANRIDWAQRTPSVFASDLGAAGEPLFGPIYGDAADLGCVLVSPRTGAETVWFVARTERLEGDVLYWVLQPTSGTVRRFAALRGVEVWIFND